MSRISILSKVEQRKFDKIPAFSREERQRYFRLDKKTRLTISKLKIPIIKIGYVLQLGYFNAFGRFYPISEFKKRDVNYVRRLLGYSDSLDVNLSRYTHATYYRHQNKIQASLHWSAFNDEARAFLLDEASRQAGLQRKPKRIFWHIIDRCWKHQFTIPSYTELAEIVTDGFLNFEETILSRLSAHITYNVKLALNNIIEYNGKASHTILTLKRIDQSLKPRDLAQSAEITQNLGEIFAQFSPLLAQLKLSDQAVEYYATWVQKASPYQLSRMGNRDKAYLYTLAFCQHQYYSRQDALMLAFLKCVSQSLTRVRNQLNQHELNTRQSRNQAIKSIVKNSRSQRELLNDIRQVSNEARATPSEKYYKIETLIAEFDEQQSESETCILEKQLLKESGEEQLYDNMSSTSKALQLRVGQILKVLTFNEIECEPTLMKAVIFYQRNNGKITDSAPIDFLKPNELSFVLNDNKVNVLLYKYLLFVHVADAVKSGNLNLKYSYRYKAISDYLLNKHDWILNRDKWLKAAGLEQYKNADLVLDNLKQSLDEKYHQINQDYAAGKNPHLSVDDNGRISIKTPKTDYDTSEFNAETLEQAGTVSIQQVMSDIHRVTGFGMAFSHMNLKHSKLKPKFNAIAAGIIGLGCNIGVNKLANISLGIGENTLRNTVNWCFSLRNLKEANQVIVKTIGDLVLAKSYVKNAKRLHSSSDGRKVGVGVDSLMASRSFKYFGKDQGVVIYTFIDQRHALFHSTVISASDREAPYVIDGLLQNNVEAEVFHSTDEHGFSEAVHAATHLIDASFAPRFKCIGKKTIYGFSGKTAYKKLGYAITPSRPIRQALIRNNWDDILRFIATIKLNHSTASQLFKRLSSYAKENPLYQALKEFGRVIKSIYILSYCSDVELRQDVQKNLSRIELSNKFSHAVFFDNDQEFRTGLDEEQELAISCKIIIQNAIVLWNYLALSELVVNTKDSDERSALVESIHRCSMLCWRHINLRGTYDFRKQAVHETRFDMVNIKKLKIE